MPSADTAGGEAAPTGVARTRQPSIKPSTPDRPPQQTPLRRVIQDPSSRVMITSSIDRVTRRTVTDDSAVSADDEDIEQSGDVGRAVIEKVLGGRLLQESED